MTKIYVCEDTAAGIYSAIYDAWKERRGEDAGIELRGMMEARLFCTYMEVEENEKKAEAVVRLIRKNLGEDACQAISYAMLSESPDKADAALRVLRAARRLKNSKKIMEHLTDPGVAKIFELSRKVSNEAHLFEEFIRFRELQSGVLFSEITPKSRVLVCLEDHFADRFPLEDWVIYDKKHKEFLLHRAKSVCVLVKGEELDRAEAARVSEGEMEIERLWKGFFQAISIRERENPVCQRTHLPIRFRKDMTEFTAP